MLYLEEIDTCPAFGWESGPAVDVLIRSLRNKHERRMWIDGVIPTNFTLQFVNIKDPDYLEEIIQFYRAMVGPLHTFLAKDYLDYRHGFAATGYAPMQFAVGDSSVSTYQLTKTYRKGSASFVRPITKPIVAAVDDIPALVVYVNGVADPSAVVDPLTGWVEFGTGGVADGDLLTWTGEYRVPVRFANFSMPSSVNGRSGEDLAVTGSCQLTEDFSYDEVIT